MWQHNNISYIAYRSQPLIDDNLISNLDCTTHSINHDDDDDDDGLDDLYNDDRNGADGGKLS